YSIQAQRYDASGSALGAQFQVNTYTTGGQYNPAVARDSNGGFVVVWESQFGASTHNVCSIQGQRFAANGSPVCAQFQVNTYTTTLRKPPSVPCASVGDFVVVWASVGRFATHYSTYSVKAQRYDANGNALGTEFQVNTWTTGVQSQPQAAFDSYGHFVVAWAS